jgi:hypothetical protein
LVTAVHINRDTDLTDVTVADPSGRRSGLHTTQHHLFWSDSAQAWVAARDLRAGDRLHTVDGTVLRVVAAANRTGGRTMRDLTVDQAHTYYVLAGSTPVLRPQLRNDRYLSNISG